MPETPPSLNRCAGNPKMNYLIPENRCTTGYDALDWHLPLVPDAPIFARGGFPWNPETYPWCVAALEPRPFWRCEGPGYYARLELCIETVVTLPPTS